MTNFTDEQFTQAMRDAVAERGENWTYPRARYADEDSMDPYLKDEYHNNGAGACVYSTPDGAPACIVGLALSKLDPELVPAYTYAHGAQRLLADLGFSLNIVRAASEAQAYQDAGKSWGFALSAYEGML